MRISDWSSDVCSSDLVDEIFDLADRPAPHVLVAVRHLRRRTGMNRDRLSGVELDAVAPRREDGLDDGEDGRMLDQRGGTFRASEQPPEPLGRRAVETALRSEEHTSELQSLMRTSYAVFCL